MVDGKKLFQKKTKFQSHKTLVRNNFIERAPLAPTEQFDRQLVIDSGDIVDTDMFEARKMTFPIKRGNKSPLRSSASQLSKSMGDRRLSQLK